MFGSKFARTMKVGFVHAIVVAVAFCENFRPGLGVLAYFAVRHLRRFLNRFGAGGADFFDPHPCLTVNGDAGVVASYRILQAPDSDASHASGLYKQWKFVAAQDKLSISRDRYCNLG
jgi:hypothetical protein